MLDSMTTKVRPRQPYAWHLGRLDVGESFIMDDLGNIECCRVSAYKYGRKRGKKYSVINTPDGFLCTRIA